MTTTHECLALIRAFLAATAPEGLRWDDARTDTEIARAEAERILTAAGWKLPDPGERF